MRLSTRGRYGTRALLDIALHPGEEPVPLRTIAARQQISLQYLEHLITPLVAAGIIGSTRGAKGGVWLARPAGEIKLSEVMASLEGSNAPVQCLENPETCLRSEACATRDVWGEVKRAIDSVLEGTTLQDLVERQRSKEQAKQTMYFI